MKNNTILHLILFQRKEEKNMNQVLLPNFQSFNTWMDSKQSYCLGGGHMLLTIDQKEYGKRDPKKNKTVKVRKGKCDICRRNKSQNILLCKWREAKTSWKKRCVNRKTVQLCLMLHGVLQIATMLYLNYTICFLILYVNVKANYVSSSSVSTGRRQY